MKTKRAKDNKNRPIQARMFSGFNDLITWLETTPQDAGWNNHIGEYAELNKAFCGFERYDDARESLRKGSNVTEIKRAISSGNCTRTTRKRGLDTIGACPNVPAVLAGSPACMYRMRSEKTRGAYNIYVDMGAHCGITKAQIRDAGIELLLRVLQLSAKYPVNLYAGDIGEYNDKISCSMTKIIDAGKPFNIARVSFALTEPAFLRVFGFGVLERSGGYWPKSATFGYGRPIRNREQRRDIVDNVLKNAITISILEVINGDKNAFTEIDKAINAKRR